MPAAISRPAAPRPPRTGIVLPRVEVFAAGVWQGDVYTIADLDDMVRNFADLYPTIEPPVKIGHDEDQEFSGVPAVGWVVRLWREGPKLFADLEQVFPEIADLIEAGAYKKVSAEIYPKNEPPEGVQAQGYIFKAVAFLGGELPHLKHLAELPAPVRFAEKIKRPRLHFSPSLCMMRGKAGQRHRVYLEASVMDRAALESQLKGIGWTDEMIAALASLSDEDLAAFVLLALAQSAGATPPAEPAAAQEVVWPEGMDRASIIAELVALGEDQAALEAMTDEELIALYNEKKAAMSETDPPDPTNPPPKPAPKPAPKPPPPPPSPTKVTYSFAERLKMVRQQARLAVKEEMERANAVTRRAGIHTFCEQMVKENRLTPAQVEVGKDGKPIGPTLKLLLSLSAVRSFAEPGKLSALELAMEEIKSRPPVRRYGEQIADPIKKASGKFAEIAEAARKRVLDRQPKGKSLEERLRMVPPRGTV